MKLKSYADLISVDAEIDYSKLSDSFWDSVSEMIKSNTVKFDMEVKSIIPTYEDMQRRFDL